MFSLFTKFRQLQANRLKSTLHRFIFRINMDEGNVSDDDTSMHEAEQTESAKRLKTDFGSVEKSEESSAKEGTSNSNTEPETASASTSSDSGFPRCRNFKNRNYRKSCDDNSRESNANDR